MEPITYAGAFSTIVGLICNFRSERKSEKQLDLKDFLNWLSDKHDEIKNLIEDNINISSGIESILKEERLVFIEKLTKIDNALASISCASGLFGKLATAVKPNSGISDQAINIIRQLHNYHASGLIKLSEEVGKKAIYMKEGGPIEIDDPRFLYDDLHILVEHDLLRLIVHEGGKQEFKITRNAIRFLETIQK
ncbi:MAG: hypothetical protein ACFFDN_46355 [Candidatus Hodarchaeota archaeon]